MKLEIKGLVRFSYLAESGFNLSRQGLEEVARVLYDPVRLERRFALFEALCLPSLRAQSDADFSVGILIGNSFPEPAEARLRALIADLPQAHLIRLRPLPHMRAVTRALELVPGAADATHTMSFRLDDDDAMHRDTIRRLREIAGGLGGWRDPAAPVAVAFNRGYYLDPRAETGLLTEYYERSPLGVGMANIAPKGSRAHVFRRNHRKAGEFFDTYTEVSRPMFIRSVHEGNDSGARPTGRRGEASAEDCAADAEANFGVSLARLRALS